MRRLLTTLAAAMFAAGAVQAAEPAQPQAKDSPTYTPAQCRHMMMHGPGGSGPHMGQGPGAHMGHGSGPHMGQGAGAGPHGPMTAEQMQAMHKHCAEHMQTPPVSSPPAK